MVKEKNSDDEVKKTQNIALGIVHVFGGKKCCCHAQLYQYTMFNYHGIGNCKAQGGIEGELWHEDEGCGCVHIDTTKWN